MAYTAVRWKIPEEDLTGQHSIVRISQYKFIVHVVRACMID